MYIWIHMPLGDVLIAHSVCIYVYILIYNTLIYIKHLTHTYTQHTHIYMQTYTHMYLAESCSSKVANKRCTYLG